MKKTSLILSLVILLIFVLGGFVFAQATKDRALEVEYPKFFGYEIEKTTTSIPEYIRYIYFSIIGLSGLIALIVLTYAGFTYLTSTGDPEKIRNAKDQIAAAFLGLIILFCSYLIVTWINPELTMLRVTSLETFIPKLSPGVWLCEKKVGIVDAWYKIINYETADSERRKEISKELKSIFSDINENCYQVRSLNEINKTVAKKIDYVYLVPLEEGKELAKYGAILFEEEFFLGESQLAVPETTGPGEGPTLKRIIDSIEKVSSILVFQIIAPPDEDNKVILYKDVDYNYGGSLPGEKEYFLEENTWHKEIYPLPFPPQSIKKEGRIIPILGKCIKSTETFTGEGEKIKICAAGEYRVFISSDPNFSTDERLTEKICDPWWKLVWRECRTIAVADTLILISGEIRW